MRPRQAGSPLNRRELQCLARIARGGSTRSVARQLALSTLTIDSYVKSAIRELRATSRSEAVAMALSLDLFDGLWEAAGLSSIHQS
jgi:DNA-binding CsgD family transcriptional regulator